MSKTNSVLDKSCVHDMGDYEDALPIPASYLTMDVAIADIVSPDILGHVVGESDFVNPPLFFYFIFFWDFCPVLMMH